MRSGRWSSGGFGAGRSTGRAGPGSSSARVSRSSRRSRGSPPLSASSRSRKREATVGERRSRRARVISTSGAPSALAKSCAASPMRDFERRHSKLARTLGGSHGSGAGIAGHTPSLSPPSTTRSARWSRASSRPQMKIAGARHRAGARRAHRGAGGAAGPRPRPRPTAAPPTRRLKLGQHFGGEPPGRSAPRPIAGERVGRAGQPSGQRGQRDRFGQSAVDGLDTGSCARPRRFRVLLGEESVETRDARRRPCPRNARSIARTLRARPRVHRPRRRPGDA